MPRPVNVSITPANVDADGICASQTPVGAIALTLDGALGTTLDYARQLCIVSASDISNRTLLFTGTDEFGRAQTETVTGPNATTVETTKYFKTITSIVISGTAAGALTVGTVDELATQPLPLEYRNRVAAMVAVDVTGTINFSVQETFDAIFDTSVVPTWWDVTALASKTADTRSQISVGARGIRIIVNSYTDTATFNYDVVQVNG